MYFFGLERNDKEKDEILDRFIQKSKSTFTPSVGRDESRDLYIELVKNDVFSNMKKRGQLNLSKTENDAFHELLHNNDIVIPRHTRGQE